MGSFWEALTGIFHREHSSASAEVKKDNRSKYIFYKIVDSDTTGEHYTLQCINTSVTFQATITDIISEQYIIHGFHPVQACYIGIEYAKYLGTHPVSLQKKLKLKENEYITCRYGNYRISYQDRLSNICFICQKSKEEFLMDPRDIALSKKLIEEFDAAQAFYIGFLAGLKLRNPVHDTEVKDNVKHPYLKIVK